MSIIRIALLGGWRSHRHILSLALPMILANITAPLVGLVDTAVLGRMESVTALAGGSIAAFIFTQIIWVCGFLRMSTTGASAEAFGHASVQKSAKILWQSLGLAVSLGLILFVFQTIILTIGLSLSSLEYDANQVASDYFTVRAYSFPISLGNMVLVGWLIGHQRTKPVLFIQIAGNGLNVALNIIFVYLFDLGVAGVALATVGAELVMFTLYLNRCFNISASLVPKLQWFTFSALVSLLGINANLFLRNVILQVCLATMILKGAQYGVVEAGINALLMQFFALIALGLDGVAFAVEAMVGKAKGQNNRLRFAQCLTQGLFWSLTFACVYACLFFLFGQEVSGLLTTHQAILKAFQDYIFIVILLPLLGHWCFFFDSVAVGLSSAKVMRNSMLVSAVFGFMLFAWLFRDMQNLGLWVGMLAFLTLRGLTLGAWVYTQYFICRKSLI